MKTGGQNLRLSGYCFLCAKSVTLTLKCLLPRMEGSFFNKTSREVAFIVLSSFLPAGQRLALLILKYSALEFHSNHAGEGKLLPKFCTAFVVVILAKKYLMPYCVMASSQLCIKWLLLLTCGYSQKQQTYRRPRVEDIY